jgi:hypothetical protein
MALTRDSLGDKVVGMLEYYIRRIDVIEEDQPIADECGRLIELLEAGRVIRLTDVGLQSVSPDIAGGLFD